MSSFSAPTRKKGTDKKFREAVWIDNYFGHHRYGVRFRGSVSILDGDGYEIKEEE